MKVATLSRRMAVLCAVERLLKLEPDNGDLRLIVTGMGGSFGFSCGTATLRLAGVWKHSLVPDERVLVDGWVAEFRRRLEKEIGRELA